MTKVRKLLQRLTGRRPAETPPPAPPPPIRPPETFAEAAQRFAEMQSARPKLKDVTLVDVSTGALLERHKVRGPVCMVGAKTYKMSEAQVANWRRAYSKLPDFEFVGVDIEPGLNVDVVADLCDPDFAARHPELVGRFGWVICGALLEHVQDPFAAARNVGALVKPGGRIYYSGPWVWGFHSYPDDLWRFSISGVKRLFDGFVWEDWFYSSTSKNVGVRIANLEDERALLQVALPENRPDSLAALLTDRAMPYLNIGAVGRKPD